MASFGDTPEFRKRILELHQEGVTYAAMAESLHYEGFLTKTGKRWTHETLAQFGRLKMKLLKPKGRKPFKQGR
jgi:hypothetical protein